ncbi:TPA: hypothetical protein ACU8BU_002322, partial [Neisseria subflava]
ITIAAKEEILITCKGAYIKLSNGEVEIGSPKVVRVRAPLVVSGANAWDLDLAGFSMHKNDFEIFYHDANLMPVSNAPYRVVLANGQEYTGKLDSDGRAVLKDINISSANVYFGYSEDTVDLPSIEDFEQDFSVRAVINRLVDCDLEISEDKFSEVIDLLLDSDLDYEDD